MHLRKVNYNAGVPITYNAKDFIPALLLYLPCVIIYYTVVDEYAWWALLAPYFKSCFICVKVKHVLPGQERDLFTPILWPGTRSYYEHSPAFRRVKFFIWITLFLLTSALIFVAVQIYIVSTSPPTDPRMIYHNRLPGPIYQCHLIIIHPLSSPPPPVVVPCITTLNYLWQHSSKKAVNFSSSSSSYQKETPMIHFRDVETERRLYYGYYNGGNLLLVQHDLLIKTLTDQHSACQCPVFFGIVESDLFFHYNEIVDEWIIMHRPHIYLNATLSGIITDHVVSLHDEYPPQLLGPYYESFYVEYHSVIVNSDDDDEEEVYESLRKQIHLLSENEVLMLHHNETIEKRRHLFTGSSAVCFIYCRTLFTSLSQG